MLTDINTRTLDVKFILDNVTTDIIITDTKTCLSREMHTKV